MYEAMIFFFEEGVMSETCKQGILNLIPKGQKDTRYLKNLRPITLLNTDYKNRRKGGYQTGWSPLFRR